MFIYTRFSNPSVPADPKLVELNFGVESLIRNEGTEMQNVQVEVEKFFFWNFRVNPITKVGDATSV